LHRILYRFSPEDCREICPHPEDGQELVVEDGPPDGAVPPDLDAEPQLTSPDGPDASELDPAMLEK
jgi:hypothetical protein